MNDYLKEYYGRKVDFEKLKAEILENIGVNNSNEYWDLDQEQIIINNIKTKQVMAWNVGETELLGKYCVDCEDVGDSITIGKVEFAVMMYLNDADEIQGFEVLFEGQGELKYDSFVNYDFIANLENKIGKTYRSSKQEKVNSLPKALETEFRKRISAVLA